MSRLHILARFVLDWLRGERVKKLELELGTGSPLSPFIPDENTQGITLKPAAMARQELLLLLGSAPILSEQGVLRA